jgi:hypothetical protein
MPPISMHRKRLFLDCIDADRADLLSSFFWIKYHLASDCRGGAPHSILKQNIKNQEKSNHGPLAAITLESRLSTFTTKQSSDVSYRL